jgi:glyoxylase-like metal-dependent hydrolase (beta-lactamase superfamily II)
VTYLIADPATLLCAFVDPVLDYDPLTQAVDTRFIDAIIADVRAKDLGPTWILETGLHTDHLSAAGHLKYETGASICIGAPCSTASSAWSPCWANDGVDLDGWDFDKLAQDGEALPMGGIEITAIALPGRLPGATAYRIGDVVFAGSALLPPDQGLDDSDAPGADAAGLHAAARQLLGLPPATRILVGQTGAAAGLGHHRRRAEAPAISTPATPSGRGLRRPPRRRRGHARPAGRPGPAGRRSAPSACRPRARTASASRPSTSVLFKNPLASPPAERA